MSQPSIDSPITTRDSKLADEEDALEEGEILELQAFIPRREWIEEKIRFLEQLPSIDLFNNLEHLVKSSSMPIPGLPTRDQLEEWQKQHDAIEQEAERFDASDMRRLKKFAKAATQRNLSPADTDLIEVTLTTLLGLDKLVHLLRARSDFLELTGLRLTWEEKRLEAWQEREAIQKELDQFIRTTARWKPEAYQQVIEAPAHSTHSSLNMSNGHGSPSSFVSPLPSTSPTTARRNSTFSTPRNPRYRVVEDLTREAARFTTRIGAWKRNLIAPAGTTLDRMIEKEKKPIPDPILDEQDRLENDAKPIDGLARFSMELVTQWKRADETYDEIKKEQAAAVSLRDDVTLALSEHPDPAKDAAFLARSQALAQRMTTIATHTNPRLFPKPLLPSYPDQRACNEAVISALVQELEHTKRLVEDAASVAKEYQRQNAAVKKVDESCARLEQYTKKLDSCTRRLLEGTEVEDGDGSPLRVDSIDCLDPMTHGAYLAVLPIISGELDEAEAAGNRDAKICRDAMRTLTGAHLHKDFSGTLDQALADFEAAKKRATDTRAEALAKAACLRDVRKVWAGIGGTWKSLDAIKAELAGRMEREKWLPIGQEQPLRSPMVQDQSTWPGQSQGISVQLDNLSANIPANITNPLVGLSPSVGPEVMQALQSGANIVNQYLDNVKGMERLYDVVTKQASIMAEVHKEELNLEERIAEMIPQFTKARLATFSSKTSNPDSNRGAIEHLQQQHSVLSEEVSQFSERLPSRVIFVGKPDAYFKGPLRSAQPTFANFLQSKDVDVPNTPAPFVLPLDVVSLDHNVRSDANNLSIRIGTKAQELSRYQDYLQLAVAARGVDDTVQELQAQLSALQEKLAEQRQIVSESVIKESSEIPAHESAIKQLETCLKSIEAIAADSKSLTTHSVPPFRDALRDLLSKPGAQDPEMQESVIVPCMQTEKDLEAKLDQVAADLEVATLEITAALQQERESLDSLKQQEEEERARLEKERLEAEARERERLLEEARLKQEEEDRIKREEEERLRLQQEEETRQRLALEEAARQQAEIEAKRLADEEAQARLEEAARLAAEREALRIQQEEDRKRIEDEARLREEQERTRKEELDKENAQKAAEEEARLLAIRQEEERLRALAQQLEEEQRRMKQEQELARQREEAERLAREEAERLALEQREIERKQQEELEARQREQAEIERKELERQQEERRQAEIKQKELERQQEEERRQAEIKQRELERQQEEERRQREQAEADRIALERQADEQRKLREKAEAEERERQIKLQEEEQKRLEEEERRRVDEEQRRLLAESEFAKLASSSILDDVFGAPSVPRSNGHSGESLTILSLVEELRRRLRSMSLQNLANPSDSARSSALPTPALVARHQSTFAEIGAVADTIYRFQDNEPEVESEIQNLKHELDATRVLLDRCQELSWISNKISGCDAALSDLLEHVDGYPVAPTTELQSSHVSDRSKPPEEQLSARLAFTSGLLKDLDNLSESIFPDSRATSERERLEQTWEELQEMCTERLANKSRPSTASGHEGSGRTSSLSVGSSSSARSIGSIRNRAERTPMARAEKTSSGRAERTPSSRTDKTPSKKQRGNIGLGPSPRPSMLSPVVPRSSSRTASAAFVLPAKERKEFKIVKKRSASGPLGDPNSSLHKSTFSSRQRTSSTVASDLPITPTKPSSSNPRSPFKTPKPLRPPSPTISEASSINTKARSVSGYSRGTRSSFSQTPKPSVPKPPVRKPYVANPKNKLDVAVGNVVNKMAVSVPIQAVASSNSNWEDKSGKYWIGDDEEAKLCFCRILRSQTVMVRVGGGWCELSKFLKDHFAHLVEQLPEMPILGSKEQKWISASTVTKNNDDILEELPSLDRPRPPVTPEPKRPSPTVFLHTPNGTSPRAVHSSGSPGSPLAPLQFIRKAEESPHRSSTPPPHRLSKSTTTRTPARVVSASLTPAKINSHWRL